MSLINYVGFVESNQLSVIENECTCPEQKLILQCSISGGLLTTWQGSIFNSFPDCLKISLRHSQFNNGAQGECRGGDLVARAISGINGIFISQLIVNVSLPGINGSTVECTYDTDNGIPVILENTVILANSK